MSLDFFTAQQGYNSNLNDYSSQVGAKQTVAKNKNALHTRQSTTQENSFEEYLNSQKRNVTKDATKTASSEATNTKVDSELKAGLDKLSLISGILTKHSNTETTNDTDGNSTPAIEGEETTLELLSNTLQALIDETIANQNDETEATTAPALIQTSEDASDTGEDALQSLLKGLVIQILGKNEEQADSPQTDEDLTVLLGGLTPQEITDLKAQINTFLTTETRSEDDEAALSALLSQFYALIEPGKRSEAKSDNTASTITDNVLKTDLQNKEAGQNTQPTNNDSTATKTDRYDSRYDARYDNQRPSHDGETKQKFDAALKNVDATATVKSETPANNTAQTSSQRFLQTTSSAIQSGFGGLDSALAQGTSAPSPTTVVQNAMTNVTTQSQSATQSHPATQLVSMTIQKAVKAGDDTNIKLRLDPPELGRVEVKMSIDKNNAKIVLTAEKPETFMMLQRDADALNRALTDAGIESGGDLSFELAGEDHDFNQNQGGHSGSSNGKRGSSDEGEPIINSKMDWYVDPDTGRMHYNILA